MMRKTNNANKSSLVRYETTVPLFPNPRIKLINSRLYTNFDTKKESANTSSGNKFFHAVCNISLNGNITAGISCALASSDERFRNSIKKIAKITSKRNIRVTLGKTAIKDPS